MALECQTVPTVKTLANERSCRVNVTQTEEMRITRNEITANDSELGTSPGKKVVDYSNPRIGKGTIIDDRVSKETRIAGGITNALQ